MTTWEKQWKEVPGILDASLGTREPGVGVAAGACAHPARSEGQEPRGRSAALVLAHQHPHLEASGGPCEFTACHVYFSRRSWLLFHPQCRWLTQLRWMAGLVTESRFTWKLPQRGQGPAGSGSTPAAGSSKIKLKPLVFKNRMSLDHCILSF